MAIKRLHGGQPAAATMRRSLTMLSRGRLFAHYQNGEKRERHKRRKKKEPPHPLNIFRLAKKKNVYHFLPLKTGDNTHDNDTHGTEEDSGDRLLHGFAASGNKD